MKEAEMREIGRLIAEVIHAPESEEVRNKMLEVFGPDGLIAKAHPEYEYRPGQIDMARAVMRAFEEKRTSSSRREPARARRSLISFPQLPLRSAAMVASSFPPAPRTCRNS
jgi:hypothetical protein